MIIMALKNNIDNEQADTIEGHFQLIMNDETFYDSKYTKITSNDLPIWFDEHLFKKGQDYFHNNLLSLMTSYIIAGIVMFADSSIAKVLISTNKSSTPCSAYNRYFSTQILIIDLHGDDIKTSDSKFYKAINTIRYMHSMACKRALRNKQKQDGIMQKHLVLGLHAFTAYTLLKPKELGLTDTKEEREAYNHFWRVIGHLLGIHDRLNVCRKNEYETTLLCEKILNEYTSEQIKKANSDFFSLINASVAGFQSIDPTLDVDALLLYFYEMNSIPYHKKIGLYSKVIYWYRTGVTRSFRLPFIGGVSRIFWNKFLTFVLWLGVNYPILAWLKFGKQNSKLKLYPYSTI